jgi:hypothetical protein
MSSTATPKAPESVTAPDTHAELTLLHRREPPYRIDSSAPRAQVTAGSHVTRGVHVKSGQRALVWVNGDTQQALPLAVVASAISGGVISGEEIAYLQSLNA